MKPSRFWRNLFIYCCLPLFGALSGVLLLEIYLRLPHSYLRLPSLRIFDQQTRPSGADGKATTITILGVGESAMIGEPYAEKGGILEIIEHYIRAHNPGTTVKIKLAAKAGATLESVLPLAQDALRNGQVDLVVAYTGNNEFLGRYSAMNGCPDEQRFVTPWWWHSALIRRLMQNQLQKGTNEVPRPAERTLFDSALVCPIEWNYTVQRFRNNLFELASDAHRANVPVILVMPSGDEVDFPPNRSVYTGDRLKKDDFTKKYREIRKQLLDGSIAPQQTLTLVEELLKVDPAFADLHYRKGSILLHLGKREDAIEAFRAARNNDGFPWSPIVSFETGYTDTAHLPGIYLLDARKILLSSTTDAMLDSRFFHDVHHLSLRGYHSIAKAIIRTIKDQELCTTLSLPEEHQWLSEDDLVRALGIDTFFWISRGIRLRIIWLNMTAPLTFDPTEHLVMILKYIRLLEEAIPGFLTENQETAALKTLATTKLAQIRQAWSDPNLPESSLYEALRWDGARYQTFREPLQLPANELKSIDDLIGASNFGASWGYLGFRITGWNVDGHAIRTLLADLQTAPGKGPDGGAIFVKGIHYDNGFGLHPLPGMAARMVLAVNDTDRCFTADFAIADSGHDTISSAICELRSEHQSLGITPLLRKGNPPSRLTVDVTGLKNVAILCDSTKDGASFDHVVVLNPHFCRDSHNGPEGDTVHEATP